MSHSIAVVLHAPMIHALSAVAECSRDLVLWLSDAFTTLSFRANARNPVLVNDYEDLSQSLPA